MAAAPFVAVTVWRTQSGQSYTQRATVSDVAAGTYVFQDASTDLTLPMGQGNVALVDVQLSAAGTDTTRATIFCNQRETGEQIQNALNLASNLSRQFLQSPVWFAPGSRVKFVQA